MKTTCGIFIFNNEGKILLGHPTKHEPDFWSIPKGVADEGEDYFSAAIREVKEETGIDLNEDKINWINKYFYYRRGEKRLFPFYYFWEDEIPELYCDSMVTAKGIDMYPEIDEFGWFKPEEVFLYVHPTQKYALEHILEIMENNFKK